MCKVARSSRGSFLSRPNAAQISPSTPDLEGSNCVSRSSNRLVVPQDCIDPCNRINKVAISGPPAFCYLASDPRRQSVETCKCLAPHLRPGASQIEMAPLISTIGVCLGKLLLKGCHGLH